MSRSVQEILNVVKASNCLGKTKRQHNLLTYLLNEKEHGRLEEITQYNIAKDVLGRGDDFDPTADSIVRVEMHRLRKNLEEFNLASEDMQIVIPAASFEVVVTDKEKPPNNPLPGAYEKPFVFGIVAVIVSAFGFFAFNAHNNLTEASPNCSSIIPNVGVVNSGHESDLQLYLDKLIRSTLSQYSNIQLMDNIEKCTNSGTPSYTLDYMVLEEDGTYRAALTTYNEQPSNIVGFKNLRGDNASPEDKDDLYYAIVRTIGNFAKPYGAIARHSITQPWHSTQAASNYECLILKYDSYTTDAASESERAAKCLSAAANTDIASLDIKAGPAEDYLSQARGYREKTVENPIVEVEKILESVGENWIDSAEMTTIKMAYETERPDYNADRLREALNVAEARYSENPLILLYVSIYSGYRLGDWDRAKILSDRIKLMQTDDTDSVFMLDAGYAFLNAAPEKIMDTCVLAYSEHSLFSNLLINACARRAKNMRWIKKTDTNLSKLGYATKAKRVAFIENKNLDEEFAEQFVNALNLPPD